MSTKNTFSLKENEHRELDTFLVKISSEFVITLKQTRTEMSFEGLNSLISSIKQESQRTPGDIFAFKKSEAQLYLKEMNQLWNTKYKLSKFKGVYIPEVKDVFFLFLVAGHRRLEACKRLKINYLTKIQFEKTFAKAIGWQISENLHEDLPLLDQITYANYLWVKEKTLNSKLTVKTFAKKYIHKSSSWLYQALKFSRLPLVVQDLIKQSGISKGVNYSLLIEFAKLYDFSLSQHKPLAEEELIVYINSCLANKFKFAQVKTFCEIRREELKGQQVLFQLSMEEIQNNSLSTIRRQRTLEMSKAKSYLEVSSSIVRQITTNCRNKAEEVIDLGTKLGKDLDNTN